MKRERKASFPLCLLLCSITQVVCEVCEGPCECPWPPPTCPSGVSLLQDGCGCCLVCARQEGESCSRRNVCDSQLGLQCDYSASFPGGPGECVRQNELGCEVEGVRYEEGQSFHLTCAQLCHCVGGGITCVPLCNEDLNLPISNCPVPKLVQLPGRCCREWVCDDLENSVLLENTAADWVSSSLDLSESSRSRWSRCPEFSGEWSACTRTCGPGVSTRISNRNLACSPQTQTRICQVRPCQTDPPAINNRVQRGTSVCKSSYRSSLPIHLEHQNCYSTRPFRPRFCGTCSDQRCCTPHRTRTVPVTFHCPHTGLTQLWVMVIESCVCHYNCPQISPTGSSRPRTWF
ncbi:CCN family member 3-like [Hoplias malabaricus]|uniref:CCN family member 3-like n=1 Tax=Hoplias malabaricus TaxID=27720 RepID=UPI003462610A